MSNLFFQSALALLITLSLSQCKKNTDALANADLQNSTLNESALLKTNAQKPKNCPDLAVTEIRVDTMANPNPALVRFRFFVVVHNIGDVTYDPAATYGQHYILLAFTAPGYIERPMAQQNMFTPINPGDMQQMLFEVNIDRTAKTLPDWENMPAPTDYCGSVLTGSAPPAYECSAGNNKDCVKDKFIKQILK